jgi:hypothetical protein
VHIEPPQLKIYAGMALALTAAIMLMVLVAEILAPAPMPQLQSMQFLTTLLFSPGVFAFGFAFIAALAPTNSPPGRDDRRRGPDGDPPAPPPGPPGRPCRRRNHSRRVVAVALPLRV